MRTLLISLFCVLCLLGCGDKSDPDTIKVGTIAGPETELMQVAKAVALKRYHLHIIIKTFTDYSIPNRALADGSIDANIFQHEPYLIAAKEASGYQLTAIAKTFIFPMGIYSIKVKSLKAVKPHDKVAIPNDMSNEARALLLLQKAQLISLPPNVSITATVKTITHNPLTLRFITLDAAQLPRALQDVTLAVINTNYAIPAGLSPTKDALFIEGIDSLYANVIVVRTKDKANPQLRDLVRAYQSPEVLKAAERLFGNNAIPAWMHTT